MGHSLHQIALALAVAIGAMGLNAAAAHEAITGWSYPSHCCGDGDCAHATAALRNPDGSLTVTTKHGTATFPARFKHDPSPDGMIHACFVGSRLYCLFLGTGI